MAKFIRGVGGNIDTFESDGTSLPNLDSISDIFILKGNNDNDDGVYFVVEDNGVKSMVYQGGLNTSTTTPGESSGYDITTTETLTGNKLDGEDIYIKKIEGVLNGAPYILEDKITDIENIVSVTSYYSKVVLDNVVIGETAYTDSEGETYEINYNPNFSYSIVSASLDSAYGHFNMADKLFYTNLTYTTLATDEQSDIIPPFPYTIERGVKSDLPTNTDISNHLEIYGAALESYYFIVEYTKTT